MYSTFYTLFEDYNFKQNDCQDINNPNQQCLICWLPSETNNPVKYMKSFSYYVNYCHCNALLHDNCFTTWLQMYSACPICRNKVSIFSLNNSSDTHRVYVVITKLTVIFVSYTSHIVTVVFLSFITYFMFYVTYIFVFSDISTDYDHIMYNTAKRDWLEHL